MWGSNNYPDEYARPWQSTSINNRPYPAYPSNAKIAAWDASHSWQHDISAAVPSNGRTASFPQEYDLSPVSPARKKEKTPPSPSNPVVKAVGKNTAAHAVDKTLIEPNATVIVHQLFGLDKKLGLNLRGLEIENFSEPEAGTIGWQKGDLIAAVNGVKVTNFEEFSRAFEKAKSLLPSRPIVFRVQRRDQITPRPPNSPATTTSPLSPSKPEEGMSKKHDALFGFNVKIIATRTCFSGSRYVCIAREGLPIYRSTDNTDGHEWMNYMEEFVVSDFSMEAEKLRLNLADGRGWVLDDLMHPLVDMITSSQKHEEHPFTALSENLRKLREMVEGCKSQNQK